MSSVLRSLMVKVGADLTDFDKSLKKMSKELKKTGKELSSAGATLTKGLTLPIVGAAAALTGLAVTAGKNADELITLSNKTGIATQALQEMQYAARFIDVEVETMTGSMQKLTKNMDMARRGTKEQEEAFKALGIEYKNQDGSLRNAKEVWAEAIDALGNIANEADRDALAMNIFGKSAVELNPLIKAGSDELKRLGEEAHTVGAVMSDESVTALGKFDDQMQKLQAVLATAGGEIGAAFIPVLEKIMPIIEEKIVPAVQKFAGFISELIDKFDNMSPEMQTFVVALVGLAVAIGPILSVIGSIVTVVSGVVGAFGAASAVITGGGGIMAALGALLGPVGIVLLVIAALAAVAFLLIKNWEPIKEFFKSLWENVSQRFTAAWENVKTFLSNTWATISDFFTGLWDSLLTGIATAWDGIKNFFIVKVPEIISNIVSFFTDLPFKIGYAIGLIIGTLAKWAIDAVNWVVVEVPKIIENIITFFSELPGKVWETLKAVVSKLGEWGALAINWAVTEIPKFISKIVNFYLELPGKIWNVLKEVLTKFGQFVSDIYTWAASKLPGVVANIVDFFIGLPGKMLDIGGNIVRGLWDGITNMASWLKDKIAGFAKGILNGIKSALGISSPSKLMAEQVGKWIPAGISKGILANRGIVSDAMSALKTNFDMNINPSMSSGIVKGTVAENRENAEQQITNNFKIQNLNVRNDNDINLIAERLYDLQRRRIRGQGVSV